MSFQRENIDVYLSATDGVNHTVFVSNATAPFTLKIAFQWFRFTQACKWMLLYVFKQGGNALHDLFITCLLPVVTVFLGLLEQNYFHRSSIATGWKLPSAISLSPWRTIFSSSAIDMGSSDFAFCAAIRFSERTAFFIKPSSDDMVWRAPKSSELSCICNTVIITIVFICLQIYEYYLN